MNKIRELRVAQGLTLKALRFKLIDQFGSDDALSVPFLSELERGITFPSIRSVAKVAKCLNSNLSKILKDSDEFYLHNPK